MLVKELEIILQLKAKEKEEGNNYLNRINICNSILKLTVWTMSTCKL